MLAAPKRHAAQHHWVRRARRLPVSLRRRFDAFRFAWIYGPPDFMLPIRAGGSLEAEIARLRGQAVELVAFEFLRPLWDHGGDRDPRVLADPVLRRRVRRRVGALGGDPQLADLLFDDPATLREQFFELLADYWDEAFAAEWATVEPQLSDAVDESHPDVAAGRLYTLLETLRPRLRVDQAAHEFGIDIPHDHRVEPTAAPDAELLGLLRTLGDDTRLRALRLIAQAPRSTQELAALVGISEAGLSKHLRVLAEAGVVNTRRDGYYVLYSVDRRRLGAVSKLLADFVDD